MIKHRIQQRQPFKFSSVPRIIGKPLKIKQEEQALQVKAFNPVAQNQASPE